MQCQKPSLSRRVAYQRLSELVDRVLQDWFENDLITAEQLEYLKRRRTDIKRQLAKTLEIGYQLYGHYYYDDL